LILLNELTNEQTSRANMPRQLRSAAQTDAWKRLTPADAAANLICIEKVALRAGGTWF
jgi:hypothetical protein